MCLEQGSSFDQVHEPAVSWTMPLLTYIGDVTAPGGEEDEAHKDGKNETLHQQEQRDFAATTGLCQVLTALHDLDSGNGAACACDSDNVELLRREVEQGGKYLGIIDDILLSLKTMARHAAVAQADTCAHTCGACSTRAFSLEETGDGQPAAPACHHMCAMCTITTAEHDSEGVSVFPTDNMSSLGEKTPSARAPAATRTVRAEVPLKTKTKRAAVAPRQRAPLYPKPASTKPQKPTKTRGGDAHKSRYMTVNAGGSSLKNAPKTAKKTTHQLTTKLTMPAQEEAMSSKEWIKRYGLKAVGLETTGYLKARAASFGLNSKKKDKCMALSPKQWREYSAKLGMARNRYQQRLDWLKADSRQVFGTIVEKNIVVAIDTSGSMAPSLPFLQRQLGLLIDQQVAGQCDKFNFIQFDTKVQPWAALDTSLDDGYGGADHADAPDGDITARAPYLIDVTDGTCAAASGWIQTLEANGSTNVIGTSNPAWYIPLACGWPCLWGSAPPCNMYGEAWS